MSKSIPELSVDAQILIERLKKASKGELIPYSELSKLIGGDVTAKERSILTRARHRVLKDDRIVFACVTGQGVKRLEDVDHIGIGQQATSKVRRLSRRAAEKMMCANYDSLDNEQRVEYNTQLSVLGALSMVTKSDKVKLISAEVQKSNEKLPLSKTLEAFKG